jgi:hypothetical protein
VREHLFNINKTALVKLVMTEISWRGIILEECVHSTSGKCGPLVASVAIEL